MNLQSDDFDHDVTLRIDGDFADRAERRAYAEWLCQKLNADPRPLADRPSEGAP